MNGPHKDDATIQDENHIESPFTDSMVPQLVFFDEADQPHIATDCQ